MRVCLIGVIFFALPALPQGIVDRNPPPPIFNRLDPQPDEKPLLCSLDPLKPTLSFGFRFRAGYVFHVPMNQYTGGGHRWIVAVEIKPDGDARAVRMLDFHRLPAVPKNRLDGEAGGGYLLGEGRYHVRWVLVDDLGRVCRKEWHIEAKLHRSESSAKVAMAPNSVAELSLHGVASANRHPDPGRPIRLSVLVDAAPLFQRRMARVALNSNDYTFLLGALSALLERVPTSSVRVVVFNLEQQRELFRRDGFTLDSLDDMSRSLGDLRLATVDSHVLQNRTGHLKFVADLVNQELHAEHLADAVIFLGPRERFQDKVPLEAFDAMDGPLPQFFFLRYRPAPNPARLLRPDPCDAQSGRAPGGRGANNPCAGGPPPGTFGDATFSDDTVSLAVKLLKGKTIAIQSPGDFARAIEQVEHRVASVEAMR